MPRLILLPLPLRKQTRHGSIGKPKLWILLALFVVPLKSLVVDKTCTTARACKLPCLCSIWPELEEVCLVTSHDTSLAWNTGERQGTMRAFHPHPYGWGISAHLIKSRLCMGHLHHEAFPILGTVALGSSSCMAQSCRFIPGRNSSLFSGNGGCPREAGRDRKARLPVPARFPKTSLETSADESADAFSGT